jgi:glycosyltransferase involved in cell wall biosynthesis
MSVPFVSVHMITYNHGPFIAKSIEGVLAQKTTFPIELVIGEDCSSDNTREIIFEFQKKYPSIIRMVTSEQNVGMKKNCYRTMRACKGKYVAFCEGDDYWQHSGKLQIQAEYLEKHPECGLVYSSYDVEHIKKRKKIRDFITYRKWDIPENPDISDIIRGKARVLTCTVMIRHELYSNIVESDPGLHKSDKFLMGDTQLWVEAGALKKIFYIPVSTATHVITEESATRSKDVVKRMKFSLSNTEMLLYLCNKYGINKTITEKYKSDLLDYKLLLSYHTHNAIIAKEVKKIKGKLGIKGYLWYWGAQSIVLYRCFDFVSKMVRRLKTENDMWQ